MRLPIVNRNCAARHPITHEVLRSQNPIAEHQTFGKGKMRDMLNYMWRAFLLMMAHKGSLDWYEVFVDESFFRAKKGRKSRKNQAGQGIEAFGIGRWQGV